MREVDDMAGQRCWHGCDPRRQHSTVAVKDSRVNVDISFMLMGVWIART
jgi:hypothetical protein